MLGEHIRPSLLAMVAIIGVLAPQHGVFAEEGTSSPVPPPAPTADSAPLPPMQQPSMQPGQFIPTQPMEQQMPGQPMMGQPPMGGERGTEPRDQFFREPQPMDGKQQFMPPQGDNRRQPAERMPMRQGEQRSGQFGPMPMQGEDGQESQMDERRQQQEVKQMQSRMRGMEQMIRSYKSQVEKLKKQGVAIPSSVSENITALETIIAAVKNAKTMEELEAAGIDRMQELMQDIDEQRGTLERLSRWGQTVKQIDRMLVNVRKQVVRDQKLATKLQKQQIDISEMMSSFEKGVNELITTRDQAAELVKTDPEAAFELIEEGIFEKMEEIMQYDRVIQGMANFGQFNSQFKRRMVEAERTIMQLKRKKVDTAALEAVVADIRTKGAELQTMMKDKSIEPQDIVAFMEEFEQLAHEFEEAKEEAMGGSDEEMPWERKGPQTFRPLSPNFFSAKRNA